MKILSVASECVPLAKTGGLADVVGALPAALAARGVEMRVMMPAYPGVLKKVKKTEEIAAEADLFGGPARVLKGKLGDTTFLLLDAPHLFARPGGLYGDGSSDFPDNPERFAALSWAACELARHGGRDGWKADVLHAHDWQAALAPAYLRWSGDTRVRSVLTIHNIAFQGIAPADRAGALKLPLHDFHADGYEYWGNISVLKAGLKAAHKITTVSPSYARELMRGEFGMGLDGVLRDRAADLVGILNGVDTMIWTPSRPDGLHPYSVKSLGGKARNRAALIAEMGLGDVPGPLAIVVSRLTGQKGIDLIEAAAPEFVANGGGLIVLGSGDPWLEGGIKTVADRLPGRVAVRIGYDEALSRRLFGGGDVVLVPSRFEPCGLTQMYGLTFGTLPVVAAVGGLNDTVIDANPAALAAGVATGFTFHPTDSLAFQQTLRRVVAVYSDRTAWVRMQKNAMTSEVGWEASSAKYFSLYQGLLR